MTVASASSKSAKLNSLRSLQTKAQEREIGMTEARLDRIAAAAVDKVLSTSEELYARVEEAVTFNADRLRPVLSLASEFDAMRLSNEAALMSISGEVRSTFAKIEKSTLDALNSAAADTDRRIHETLTRIAAEHTREYRFHFNGRPDVKLKNPHRLMPELMRHIALRQDVALVGPSGSGKTSATRQAAEALGHEFYFMACADDDMTSKWFGYINPVSSEYVATPVYEWFVNGGLLLIDEYDNMRPNIGVRLNAMLDNGIGDFPGGRVQRHPDAICVASGNTIGRGATRVYRGRHGLDESTIERFDVIEWGYDEDLERKISDVDAWTEFVIACRHAMLNAKLDYVISPRASMKGGRLLLSGLDVDRTIDRVLFKMWAPDDRAKVMRDNSVQLAYGIVKRWDQEFPRPDGQPHGEPS